MPTALNERGCVYLKQGRAFIYLRQNPLVFAWLFLVKSKILKLHALGVEKITGLKGLRAIIRYRLWRNVKGRQVWLPVSGNMALKVHRGYKVFDFQRRVVIRVMDRDLASRQVEEELMSVNTAAELEFAPKIYQRDEKQKWYEEEYITGDQGVICDQSRSGSLFSFFDHEITRCLESMLDFRPIVRVETKEYLANIERILNERLTACGCKESNTEDIKRFLFSSIVRLRSQSPAEIFTAFSHGDFSLVNILSTEEGMRVIDWEGAKHRGLLNDFYNFFLTEMYYGRAYVDIAAEVNSLGKRILQNIKCIPAADGDRQNKALHFYRRLYYIERVTMLMERDITDKNLSVILTSIEVFNRFERECQNLIATH